MTQCSIGQSNHLRTIIDSEPTSTSLLETAKIMCARSVDLFDAKYTSILLDGDAAIVCALNNLQPYGADVPIEKHECINHMGKKNVQGSREDCEGVSRAGGNPRNREV